MMQFLFRHTLTGLLILLGGIFWTYFSGHTMLLSLGATIVYSLFVGMPPYIIFGLIYFYLIRYFNKEHTLMKSIQVISFTLALLIAILILEDFLNGIEFDKAIILRNVAISFTVGIVYTIIFHQWLYPKQLDSLSKERAS